MSVQISVIVPVLNEYAELEKNYECFRAIIDAGIELIFVDGGSTDNSRHFLESRSFRVVSSEAGRARQMNAGSEYACGEYLFFLHVDTALPPPETYIASFSSNPAWGFFEIHLSGQALFYRAAEYGIRLRSFLFDVATGDQVMFFRKDFFEQLGGFPDLELMEDIAMSRLAKKYSKPVHLAVKAVSSSRRWEKNGPIKTCVFMWYIQVLYKFGVCTETLNRLYREDRWI